MQTVQNILDKKHHVFNQVASNMPVIEALHFLNSLNAGYLLVLDGGEYKGIFSETDYTRNMILKGQSCDATLVRDAMTTDLPIVESTDSVEHCMQMMRSHRTRYLLSYHDRKFSGVITDSELLLQVMDCREKVFEVN